MKKTISIMISFIMLTSLFLTSIVAQAKDHDETSEYKCGDYYIMYMSVDSIPDGSTGDCYLMDYIGNQTSVVIPSEISNGNLPSGIPRTISYMCFEECNFLVDVTLPDTIETIIVCAFFECPNLEKIVIPPSVKTIEKNAFTSCDKLTIYGYTNTVAETYAKENNIPFKSIGVVPTEPTTPNTTKTPVSTIKTTAKTTAKVKTTAPTVTAKKATIKKLTPKKKALKVIWKKVNEAQGYEIKLATNKKFTKNKKTVKIKKGSATSKIIKKLKSGKKYFVKIRAYKKVTVDGYTVTANGDWSNTKSKKVK